MLLLTCEKCQTQYRLDPAALGKIGRDVRCTRCSHMWFEPARQPEKAQGQESAPLETTASVAVPADDASFDDVMAAINATMQSGADEAIPEAVRPSSSLPISATVLPPPPFSLKLEMRTALLSFLLMVFVSLGIATPLRESVVGHWPAAALFFEKAGFTVPVTGDGLRLADLKAAYREDAGKYILDVSGSVTNIDAHSVKYPVFKIILQGKSDSIKEWRLEKEGQSWIGPGDTKPMKFSFPDVPPEGVAVTMTFTE